MLHGGYQPFVGRKSRSDQSGKQNHEKDKQQVERKHHPDHDFKAVLHPLTVPVAVVVTHDGNKTLCEPCQRYADGQHRTLHDGQCADIDVAIHFQAAVQHKTHQTFRTGHDERGHAQGQCGADDSPVGTHIPPLDSQRGLARGQEMQHPPGTASLREDSGQGRPFHPHAEHENEQRIETDVQQRADDDRAHGYARPSLRIDESVQPHRDLHEQRPQQIHRQIIHRITYRMFRCPDGHQQGTHGQVCRGRCQDGEKQEQYQSVPQYLASSLPVALPQRDGSQRCASRPHDGGEGGNQDDDRTGHSDTGQRVGTDTGNMADVNTVHDVIKQVDDLCGHSRKGHPEHQRQHAVRTQPLFV